MAVQFTTAANENLVPVDVERVVNAVRSQLPPEAVAPTIVKPEVKPDSLNQVQLALQSEQLQLPAGQVSARARDIRAT